MGSNFVSGLVAGVTAAVIWMSISMIVDLDAATVGLWALVFLVAVTAITTAIARVIARNGAAGRA